MRGVVLPSLLLACAAVQPATLHAQAVPDTACSYSRCGLRIDYRFLSTRLVRGTTGESVARLGWFGRGVDVLLAGPDSAAYHARQYRSSRTTSDVLGFASAALALAGVWQTDDFVKGRPLFLAGVTLELIALPFWLSARRSLDRSVWWYNGALARP
jgi:hypothetical protein